MSLSADPLAPKLSQYAQESAQKLPEGVPALFEAGVEAVADTVKKAKQVGEKAPDFTLKNAQGEEVQLAQLLKKGPVVLTWYRGGWCPYCNITLAALQEELPNFEAAGAQLLALTPELPDKSLSTQEKNELKFPVLTDLNSKVAEEYGLLFKLTPEVAKVYDSFFDLEATNGAEAPKHTLPLAATYIIGQDGTIQWAFLDADYKKRAEPSEISAFLKK